MVGENTSWVDDGPDNNIYERRAFESMRIEFTLALSSHEALNLLPNKRFAAIISIWAQRGAEEGYVLLDATTSDGQTALALTTPHNANIEHWHSEIETDRLES